MPSADPVARWTRHGPTCICRRCRGARKRRERDELRQQQKLVYADDMVADHVRELQAAGMSQREIASRANVSQTTVSRTLRPGCVLDQMTALRILAVIA